MGQKEWDLWKDGFVKGCVIGVTFTSMFWVLGILIFKLVSGCS